MRMTSREISRFWSRVDGVGKWKECWLWTGSKNQDGYGNVYFAGKWRKAHRIAYFVTYGLIVKKLFVCHHCDNPSCCNPEHLFQGTASDNAQDSANKGRCHLQHKNYPPVGEKQGRSKLTAPQVLNIRQRYAGGEYQFLLAAEFGVTAAAIGKVTRRESWKHI